MGGSAGALREILVVLALGLLGLLLALAAAFGPWYPAQARPSRAVVVELHSPAGLPTRAELTTVDAG